MPKFLIQYVVRLLCGRKKLRSLRHSLTYMLVIGGRSSSNTIKLADICSQFCETDHIEKKSELDKTKILRHNRIGVTAGASTPADIIKEVLNTMTEILETHDEELNFAELLEQSLNENYIQVRG